MDELTRVMQAIRETNQVGRDPIRIYVRPGYYRKLLSDYLEGVSRGIYPVEVDNPVGKLLGVHICEAFTVKGDFEIDYIIGEVYA